MAINPCTQAILLTRATVGQPKQRGTQGIFKIERYMGNSLPRTSHRE